jgi:cyclic-di-GMP phosphodiesterase, flagellum assembly factor TipF
MIGVVSVSFALASRPIERKHGPRLGESPFSGAGLTLAGVEQRMGRLGAIFVAICMILIACSVGAVLYLRFGLNGTEAAIVALIGLIGLVLLNAVSGRLQDGGDHGGRIDDLARGTGDLARQVAELNRRVAAIEGKAQAAVEKTLAATQPLTAEMGEVGGLIQQIAETVAAHETQLKELAPAPGTPEPLPPATQSASPDVSVLLAANPAAASAVKPAEAPTAPLVAALPAEAAVPPEAKPTEVALAPSVGPLVYTAPVFTAPTFAAPAAPASVEAAGVAPAAPLAVAPTSAAVTGKLTTPVFAKATPAAPGAPAAAAPPVADPLSTRIVSGRFKDMEPSAVIAMIREAVDNNRVDLFLQPIVTLPQRKVRYYEAVARLRAGDGEPVMAADFLPYAEAGGLMPKIDNLMMFRCVQVVRRLLAKNREIGLFCNVSTSTLVDSATFSQFTEFMEANKAIAPALVFEFSQAAVRTMGPIENESLAALAQRGYRFSLDNVADLRIEPRDLADRGFRFVKVQASLLLNRSGIALTDIHPQDFAGLLSRFGIELVAAKIESEAAVVDLLDYDVKFGQGFLFSPPRPVRPEVMQGIADRSDVVVREAGDAARSATAAPVVAGAPVMGGARVSSIAQLARGVVVRAT